MSEDLTFSGRQAEPPPWLPVLPSSASPTPFLVSPMRTSFTIHMSVGWFVSKKPGLRQYAVLNRRENDKLGHGLSQMAQGSKSTHRTVPQRNVICQMSPQKHNVEILPKLSLDEESFYIVSLCTRGERDKKKNK